MKGYAKPLHEFISGQQIQFVIPVYQRNYDWRIDNWNEYRKEEAYDLFLNAKYCNSERKIKLVPIENDHIAYDKIFNGEDSFDEDSKVTRNYRHFYDLLTRKPQALSFDQLLDTI